MRVCSSSGGVPNGANFAFRIWKEAWWFLNVKRSLLERGYGIDVNG